MYINIYNIIYVTSIFMCFSSGVCLCFRILMYVKCHEQFEIGCGDILNIIYYNYSLHLPSLFLPGSFPVDVTKFRKLVADIFERISMVRYFGKISRIQNVSDLA